MSYEEEEMLQKDLEEIQKQMQADRVKAIKSSLEKTKPFKDFITGREAEWEKLKDLIGLTAYQLPAIGNDLITKDFIAGIRYCTELIDGRVQEFNKAFEELGKE